MEGVAARAASRISVVPLILTQHSSEARDLNRYLDREGVIYHFPSQYLGVLKRSVEELGDRRFIYHRPRRGATQKDAGRYFGYGTLGDPYPDVQNAGRYFVNIYNYERIVPVPLRRANGVYYETGTVSVPNLRGRSIRYIDPRPFLAILEAGQAYSPSFEPPADLQDTGVFAPGPIPRDGFRRMDYVPAGTGYVPHGSDLPDRFETAALHERARSDHQETLQLILEAVQRNGGTGLYNNNVDLFVRLGEARFLIEAKSLTRPEVAVDRMRYGLGQLMDYTVRYRADLLGAAPVLAFGTPPARDASWIATILSESKVAFIARAHGELHALNELGRDLPFVQH